MSCNSPLEPVIAPSRPRRCVLTMCSLNEKEFQSITGLASPELRKYIGMLLVHRLVRRWVSPACCCLDWGTATSAHSGNS